MVINLPPPLIDLIACATQFTEIVAEFTDFRASLIEILYSILQTIRAPLGWKPSDSTRATRNRRLSVLVVHATAIINQMWSEVIYQRQRVHRKLLASELNQNAERLVGGHKL